MDKGVIDKFFKKEEVSCLEYRVEKCKDSANYTVIIKKEGNSFKEVFDLARSLNRQAVWKELGFTVIADLENK